MGNDRNVTHTSLCPWLAFFSVGFILTLAFCVHLALLYLFCVYFLI